MAGKVSWALSGEYLPTENADYRNKSSYSNKIK